MSSFCVDDLEKHIPMISLHDFQLNYLYLQRLMTDLSQKEIAFLLWYNNTEHTTGTEGLSKPSLTAKN